MHAVLLTAAGNADVLHFSTEVPLPQLPGPHFMRVRLHAAGLNPVDYKLRQRGGFFPQNLPTVLGCDGAGVVEEIGAAVSRFKPGDAVYFFNGGLGGVEPGNYAQYTVIHEDYAAPKPACLSFIEAAAVPLAFITAWEALIDRAHLTAGQSVLIHAGAGGVGHLAVQLAKIKGAKVVTTVSNVEKAAFVRELGADHCILYRDNDFVAATLDWSHAQGVDVVMDNVGGDVFCASFNAAKIYGQVVTLLEPPCDSTAIKVAKLRNLSLSFELMLTPILQGMHTARLAQTQMLQEAGRLFEQGHLHVKVTQVFPLHQAAHAHRLLEEGHVRGKIVLDIASA
jgi:NADPH:quinone reductase